MTSNLRKPPPEQSQPPGRRQVNEGHGFSNQSTTNPATSHSVAASQTSSGVGRMGSSRAPGSPMSARAAARKPAGRSAIGGSLSKPSETIDDDNARAEHAQIVEDLKRQVQRAENASEQHQKEMELAKMRLNEVVIQRDSLEDLVSSKDAETEAAQTSLKDAMRQKLEVEQAHKAEKEILIREREDQMAKEQDLQSVIQRLNETIRQKELRANAESERSGVINPGSLYRRRSSELDPGQLSPTAQLERSPSRNNSRLLLQKDQMVEALRMELAEVQIKLAEVEHVGDGRLQAIEKQLLDTKMANARLMEDNESFQLLLSEKTLKGDFMHEARAEIDTAGGMGTLADELESAGHDGEGESSETHQKLETELKFARGENKALTLYIDKIVGRLLQHDGFEHIIHDKEEEMSGPPKATDKALPPPPPDESGGSLLQRARSVVSGKSGRPAPRARPMSYMPAASVVETAETASTAHENPETAPSIPLARGGHWRSRSDYAPDAPAVPMPSEPAVSQMPRGPPLPVSVGGRASPGGTASMTPSISSNRSPGVPASNPPSSRIPSGAGSATAGRTSRTNSVLSAQSGGSNSQDPPSPPRDRQGPNALPGAVMKQSQLRPLRLVRQNTSIEDEESARKKANRGSWVPAWFNRASFLDGDSVKPT